RRGPHARAREPSGRRARNGRLGAAVRGAGCSGAGRAVSGVEHVGAVPRAHRAGRPLTLTLVCDSLKGSGAGSADRPLTLVQKAAGERGSASPKSRPKARTVARAKARISQGRAEAGPSRTLEKRGNGRVMTKPYVGIDVAKATLDVAIGSDGELAQVENNEAGIARLVERLGEVAPTLVVLEATGGYESVVAAAIVG